MYVRLLDTEAQVARLNLQGVSALNHNQPQKAREFFQQAYKLDPRNAFALNNMGYVAEMNGDQETAQELYREAKAAPGAGSRVSVATRREMVGAPLAEVANTNDQAAQANMEAVQEARRRQGGALRPPGRTIPRGAPGGAVPHPPIRRGHLARRRARRPPPHPR